MAGDDLSIFLFFLTCAVAFGVEAVKAETAPRRISFATIAAVCLGSGIFWTHLKTLWPALSERVAAVATNPVSWFVIVMFFLAVFAFHRPRPKNIPVRVETTKKLEITPKFVDPAPLASVVAQGPVQPSAEPKREPEPKKEEPREFVDTTPEYLLTIRSSEGMSRVQTDKVLAPYLGKWMKITGTVREVYPNLVSLQMGEGHGDKARNATLQIDDKQKPKFHLLELNKQISVIGQIARVYRSEIELDHCELVD
jgi:hypothetical protein